MVCPDEKPWQPILQMYEVGTVGMASKPGGQKALTNTAAPKSVSLLKLWKGYLCSAAGVFQSRGVFQPIIFPAPQNAVFPE